MTEALTALDAALDAELAAATAAGAPVPRVSVWCGHPGQPPAYQRDPDALYYAASTMKVAVMLAAFRRHEADGLDLDQRVTVVNHFPSAYDGVPFSVDKAEDNDDQVWDALGTEVPLRWLIERMIVRSSNFATNLVFGVVGAAAVDEAVRATGASRMRVRRGIEDARARDHGLNNEVTAADLARLMGGLALGRLASTASCAEMMRILYAQEWAEKIRAALPPGTRVANKDGWVGEINHDAALVVPDDAPPYLLVVCTEGYDEEAGKVMCRRVAAASWQDRHDLDTVSGLDAGSEQIVHVDMP
jgi:beta-lactamase class A